MVFACIDGQSVIGIGVHGMKVKDEQQTVALESDDQVPLVRFHMAATGAVDPVTGDQADHLPVEI